MKKLLQLLLALGLALAGYAQDPAYPPVPAAMTNIVAAEYFIDKDPGFGAGTAISVSAAVDISNAVALVNTNGLNNGVHRLFLRTRNEGGVWSLAASRDFLYDADKPYVTAPGGVQNIVRAEYFFDTDPGMGSATAISITPGMDLSNITAVVSTAGLSNGSHRLYIRTQGGEGRWSLAARQDFSVDFNFNYPSAPAAAQNVVAAEYFFDVDPGFGGGTAIAITSGLDLAGVGATVNTGGLGIGVHRLYVRTKNQEGRWSLTAENDIVVNSDFGYPAVPAPAQQVVAAEYFFDVDPGFGGGTAIAITSGLDLAGVGATVNTGGLGIGVHRLYVRTKNQEGRWSLTAENDIVVNSDFSYPAAPAPAQQVVVAEYFFDVDPGFGGGTAIAVTPGLDLAGVSFAANTAGLSEGRHTFYLRTRGQEGRWSLTQADTLYVGVRPPGWAISPAVGHDFGTVLAGTPTVFNFTIRNTGSQPVVLRNAFSTDSAFAVGFTAGTSIAAGDSSILPVTFTSSAVAAYSGKIRIVSDPGGPDTATVVVTGSGRVAGTQPSLHYPAAQPFGGIRGVSADAGPPNIYTYKIVYRSATGRAPQTGYPKLGIDRNGDGDFGDAGEGLFSMSRETGSTDYTTGVVYTYSMNYTDYTNTLGYKFFAVDDQGNTAGSGDTSYKSGPVITYQLLDLRIFANDISFSKTNPLPGESFTLTANVSNSSAYSAINVPVKFYKDTILLDSAVVSAVPAFGAASITKVFAFPTDGFYPIKVWIDSARTLSESNYLNNYAIRPINVGVVVLPGGIKVTTTAMLQSCPQAVVISGTATYFGTASPTPVAGSEVTINTGTQVFTTTTDANGNYSYLVTNPVCGGMMNWTVSVTDFTFTSAPVTGSLSVPCPDPNACVVTPQPGVSVTSGFGNSVCSKLKGSTGVVNVTVTYRSRNISNMWCLWDKILKDTVKIFQDGVLIQTYWSADGSTSPGDVKTIPVNVSLNSTGANVIEARQTYVYDEFFQNEDNFYHGILTPYSGAGTITVLAEANTPDLQIQGFSQTGFTSFGFADVNAGCGSADAHTVQIWDSIPGGAMALIKSYAVGVLAGKTQQNLIFSDPAMTTGDHYITIITDAGDVVAEQDETNNIFRTKLVVPAPDLTVGSIKPSFTSALPGQKVSFMAEIRNSGRATAGFKVAFRAGGALIGSMAAVAGVGEKSTVTVVSDPYTVTTAAADCPVTISVEADAAGEVTESSESNNTLDIQYASDIAPYALPGEVGSAANPVVVRVNESTIFHPFVRNIGTRDINGVTVRYSINGVWAGGDNIGLIRAGEAFAATGTFSHVFTVAGDYTVRLETDTANSICEVDETNNAGDFYIRVVESNPDLEVLSQYISPSSLNPNPGQAISIVGTVRNVGLKASQANVMRFMVDDIQLGDDVPLNALQPGRDTTVAATVSYSSLITGVKAMKILVNPARAMVEEQYGNNEATRALIVGDAPDLARSRTGAISFNPNGFVRGDSVWVSYDIKNNGAQQGTAWLRFRILDVNGVLTGEDSLQFTLAAGANTTLSRRMLFSIDRGSVIAEIINCSPMEFDLLNNNDTLNFSTVMKLKSAITVNGDLDLKGGLPEHLPGWIGGKLLLGDNDLVVNGEVMNFDLSHFVITDGAGRLKLVNSNASNTFPIGTSETSPNFVRINNTGTPDNYSARVLPYVLRGGTGGDTVKAGSVNRTWLLEEQTAGGSNASVEFYWSSADEQTGFDPTMSRIAHYAGGWTLGAIGSAAADTNGQLSRLQAGYTSFSPFTVITGDGTNLPLRLLQFGVSGQGADALLRWTTTNEEQTSMFVIEHSVNGVIYTAVGTVASLNAAGVHEYEYLHEKIGDGLHYYRLKMLDLDGGVTYSPVKTLLMNGAARLSLYPNPAEEFVQVKGLEPGGRLMLLTMDGKVVTQWNVTGSSMSLELQNVAAGSYLIRYVREDRTELIKFIKK